MRTYLIADIPTGEREPVEAGQDGLGPEEEGEKWEDSGRDELYKKRGLPGKLILT